MLCGSLHKYPVYHSIEILEMDCQVTGGDNPSDISLVNLKGTKRNDPEEEISIGSSAKSPTTQDNGVDSPLSKHSNGDSPGRSSPDMHCAICLSRLENKSFTDSCFHQFCFTCLLEWSKVKAECPLCKQAFKSIIHNVRSIEDYDQYYISGRSQDNRTIRSPDSRRFRYPSTLTSERRRQRSFEQTLEYENFRHSFVPHMYRGLNARYPIWNRPTTSDYRRRIYENGEWVRIQGDSAVIRYRETSPEFYRQNPACTHRLIPWLNRELIALLMNSENQVAFVLELILALIMRYGIRSEEFYEHILPYLQDRTSHFIHEFYNFARSVYDMTTYDELVQYDRLENLQGSSNTSSPSSIIEVPIESFVSRNRGGTSSRTNKNQTQGSASVDVPGSNSVLSLEDLAVAGPSGTSNTERSNDNHYDSDTEDDCIILKYVKPLSDRTPETIVIFTSSDDDDDEDDETQNSRIDSEPSDRPSRRARCDFHYDYSSDSCSDRKEVVGTKESALKVKIKSFLGTVCNVQIGEEKRHHHSSHKKHKKHKKHKSHKHRHRHHKKRESKEKKDKRTE